jgi:TetR/AcrR family transcriptional regulator, transcriptional repressor for nem operon
MRKPQPDKRTRLIETAMKLAYRNGFRGTSLADIAEAAHVPLGNVYYYFKTKQELGEAVVELLLAQFRELREQIDRLSSPKERLFAFVESIRRKREQLARGGCPLGSLCSELHKEGGALAKRSAALFTEPMGWLEEQFRAAGHEGDARELSAHLFCAYQGMAAVAHAAHDPDLVLMEVKRLKDWIGAL